jgi:hypothetical protein
VTPHCAEDRAAITDIIRDKVHELLEGLSEMKISTRASRVDRDGRDARTAAGA